MLRSGVRRRAKQVAAGALWAAGLLYVVARWGPQRGQLLPAPPNVQRPAAVSFANKAAFDQTALVKPLRQWRVSRVAQRFPPQPAPHVALTERIYYEPFLLPLPLFAADADRSWFLGLDFARAMLHNAALCDRLRQPPLSELSAEALQPLPHERRLQRVQSTFCAEPSVRAALAHRTAFPVLDTRHIYGQVDVVRRAQLPANWDCGWTSRHDDAARRSNSTRLKHYARLWYLLVPDGGSLQHFVDGVLPKMAQTPEWLNLSDAQVYLELNAKYPVVNELLTSRLKLRPEQLVRTSVWGSGGGITADELLLDCVAPPVHPYLWQKAQELLGVEGGAERRLVVYASRAEGSVNGGRRVVNEEALVKAMREAVEKEGFELAVFAHTQAGELQRYAALWRRAAVVVGPHGGALSNLMLVPPGAAVIELLPKSLLTPAPQPLRSALVMYLQAVMLRHHYWMIPVPNCTANHNMYAPVNTVVTLISQLLSPDDL